MLAELSIHPPFSFAVGPESDDGGCPNRQHFQGEGVGPVSRGAL